MGFNSGFKGLKHNGISFNEVKEKSVRFEGGAPGTRMSKRGGQKFGSNKR